MTAHPSMNDFLGLLDKWRHFAGFPLEARSEVFFALFLPTALEKSKCVGVKIKPHIIPQFPLRQNKLDKRTNKRTNRSDKVDFFALSECGKRAFFIELKTDMRSRRGDQDAYLETVIGKCMDEILHDLKNIVQASNEKEKYYHLLNALSELCLIELSPNLEGMIYKDSYKGISEHIVNKIGKMSIVKSPALEVVYVQPYQSEEDKCRDKQFHYIYFDELADIVESQGDMGGLFAGYLRKWITDPANHPPK